MERNLHFLDISSYVSFDRVSGFVLVVSFVSLFFFGLFGSLANFGRSVLFFFWENMTVLMVRMKYDRFLQVVAEHVTIIWRVLLITWRSFSLKTRDDFLFLRSAFPINFYRIRVKKYKHMLVMKNKGKFKVREIASNRPLLLHPCFLEQHACFPQVTSTSNTWECCNWSRYKQCKVVNMIIFNLEWLSSIFCFITLSHFYHLNINSVSY